MNYLMGIDASVLPRSAPPGTQFAMGYIGGDTPHVATLEEWYHWRLFHKVPIFTRSNPEQADPEQDGFDALRRLYEIGTTKGKITALDYETAIDPAYAMAYHRVLTWGGYKVILYGSASTVFANPPLDGYWVADWNPNVPLLFPHANVVMRQWSAGLVYDIDYTTSYEVTTYMWQ